MGNRQNGLVEKWRTKANKAAKAGTKVNQELDCRRAIGGFGPLMAS
jgi:hypothetical protein